LWKKYPPNLPYIIFVQIRGKGWNFSIFEDIYSVYLGFSILFIYEDINIFWNLIFQKLLFFEYYYLVFFFVLYPSAVSSAARLLSPSAIYHPPSITRRLLICLYQFLSIDFFISTRFYQIISVICYLYQFLSIKLFESFIAMNLSYQFISINFYQFNFINLFLLIYLY
jgi:hypothetical protein